MKSIAPHRVHRLVEWVAMGAASTILLATLFLLDLDLLQVFAVAAVLFGVAPLLPIWLRWAAGTVPTRLAASISACTIGIALTGLSFLLEAGSTSVSLLGLTCLMTGSVAAMKATKEQAAN